MHRVKLQLRYGEVTAFILGQINWAHGALYYPVTCYSPVPTVRGSLHASHGKISPAILDDLRPVAHACLLLLVTSGGMGGVVFSMSWGSKMGVGVGVEVHVQNYLNLKEAELEKMKSDARHRHKTVNR